jgi:tripartite-type tricarboxylate transporter receptor subunit TctC
MQLRRIGRSKLIGLLVALAILRGAAVGTIPAMAQDYPSGPLHLIVPYAPGGTADTIARIISKYLARSLGQTVVVDNRAGAGGLIGAAVMVQSPADGYTIGVLATPHAATPLDPNSGFDRARVKAVALLAVVPGLLCVNRSVPASSLSDVIGLARSKPGQLSYGNPGNFTAGHLAMEMLKAQARVDIISVPYRGGAPALQDLVAGQIQMSISGPSNFLPYIKNGQLRAIASSGRKRSTAVPDVPTFSESGMSGFELNEWYGIFAPNKTPPELVARLNHVIVQALAQPDVRAFFATIGAEPGNMSPGEFDGFFRNETDRLGKLVRSLGLKNE